MIESKQCETILFPNSYKRHGHTIRRFEIMIIHASFASFFMY